MMILRGVTLFLYCDLGGGGGLWKIFNENDIEHRGPTIFLRKKKRK